MPDASSPRLADLREGDEFEGFYLVRESSLQTTVNGKQYIRMTVSDSGCFLPANVWDANRDLFLLVPAGSVVKLQGSIESYKGKLQVRIVRFRPAHASEVDPDSFLPRTPKDIVAMREELQEVVDALRDPDYAALGKAFFKDAALMDRFARSPAAREVHHAYIGGLLEHTLSMARIAKGYLREARIDGDLLMLGVLLHDVGKTEELSVGLGIEYTDRGKLLGHIFIGSEMVGERVRSLPRFPAEKLHLVQHLILSHHGRHEYGSPVLPKIPEAFALHHIDNLDAKVTTAHRLLDAIQDPDNRWTEFSRILDTALYRATNANQDDGHA